MLSCKNFAGKCTRTELSDKARSHIAGLWLGMLPHAPYSPGMCPPDFRLVPKVKRTYAWATFSFSGRAFYRRDGTRVVQHMNKSGVLDVIIMVPKRWDSAIEKQGAYIEGL